MFIFFKSKKSKCEYCKTEHKKSRMVNYAEMDFCSENCFVSFFRDITTEELLELDKKDKEINPGYHRWIAGKYK